MSEHEDEDEEDLLDNDELGEKIEHAFGAICADARLVANKSNRDRAGWDYNINGRIDVKSRERLDSRPNPLACVMQVKGMWARNERIRVRLTSAEQLAKDPKPAFICAIKVNEDLSLNKCYIIHLRGELLARVLERLRRLEATGKGQANKIYLDFYASRDGIEIDPIGSALRRQLEKFCGQDPALYVEQKMQELRSLGFQGNAIHVSATLKTTSPEDFRNIFFGRQSEAHATIDSIVETRFGIPIQRLQVPTKGTIRLEHLPRYRGTVVLRKDKPRIAATAEADIYVAPNVGDLIPKGSFRAKTKFFDFTIIDGNLSVETLAFDRDENREIIQNWVNLVKCYAVLATGSCEFAIRVNGRIFVKGVLKNERRLFERDGLEQALRYAEQIEKFFGSFGIPSDRPITYSDLFSQSELICFLMNLIDGKIEPGKISFAIEAVEDYNPGDVVSARLNSFLNLSDQLLFWSVIMEMDVRNEGDNYVFVSRTVSLTEVDLITPEEYSENVAKSNRAQDVQLVMSKNLSGGDESVTIVKIDDIKLSL